LDRLADAADLISESDVVDQNMWRGNKGSSGFELKPFHALLSTVFPARMVAGQTAHMEFPNFLGRYSTASKNTRLLQELTRVLSAKRASLGRQETSVLYLPLLRERLMKPLIQEGKEGIAPVLALMDEYGLTREDWTTLSEMSERVSGWKSKEVETSVKSAFTREYNKHVHTLTVQRSSAKGKSASKDGKRKESQENPQTEDEPEKVQEENGEEVDRDGDGDGDGEDEVMS